MSCFNHDQSIERIAKIGGQVLNLEFLERNGRLNLVQPTISK